MAHVNATYCHGGDGQIRRDAAAQRQPQARHALPLRRLRPLRLCHKPRRHAKAGRQPGRRRAADLEVEAARRLCCCVRRCRRCRRAAVACDLGRSCYRGPAGRLGFWGLRRLQKM